MQPQHQTSTYATIGTLGEKSLHAALKHAYAEPHDQIEALVKGYHIDILRPPTDVDVDHDSSLATLIEIQTGNFSGIKTKLHALLPNYRLHIVHPIPLERWLTVLEADGEALKSRRKSNKRGRVEEVFRELVSIPDALIHPHFSLEVALVRDEEIRVDDGRGSWRRKHQRIQDRLLREIVHTVTFATPHDYLGLLPKDLPAQFTARHLATAAKLPLPLAGKMVYSLRHIGVLHLVGKQGKAYVYTRLHPSLSDINRV